MNKLIKIIVTAVITVLIIFFLNDLKKQNNYDRYFKSVDLSQNNTVTYVIDIAKMGTIKYYLQPDTFSMYLKLKNDCCLDNISFKLDNLKAVASQSSKKGEWKKLDSGSVLQVKDDRYIPLNLEINIPTDKRSYQLHDGSIIILQNEKIIKIIELKFVNSKYKK